MARSASQVHIRIIQVTSLVVESGHTQSAIACFYASFGFGFISTDTPYNNVLNGTYNTLSNSLPCPHSSTHHSVSLPSPLPSLLLSTSTLPKLFYAIQKGIVHRIRKCEWGQVKENVDELCKRNENEQETS